MLPCTPIEQHFPPLFICTTTHSKAEIESERNKGDNDCNGGKHSVQDALGREHPVGQRGNVMIMVGSRGERERTCDGDAQNEEEAAEGLHAFHIAAAVHQSSHHIGAAEAACPTRTSRSKRGSTHAQGNWSDLAMQTGISCWISGDHN